MTSLRECINDNGSFDLISQFRRERPSDYDDFIGVLYQDLDILLGLMESDAKDLGAAGEDFLNRELVRLLRARCYNASHDHDEGGHVDIHVRSTDQRFSWLGEAKLDNGPAYLLGGLNQLVDRYAKGTPGHNHGGLLIYIQKDKASERTSNWKEALMKTNKFDGLEVEDCPIRKGLSFYSKFVLQRIGKDSPKYVVKHIAVSLYRPASHT